jgi:hypothetical protein
MTKRALARRLGCTSQAIHYHLRTKANTPPLDNVSAWKTFMAKQTKDHTLTIHSATVGRKIARARLAILTEIHAEKAHQRKLRESQSIAGASVRRYTERLVHHFFSQLDRLARELPSTLKGKDEIGINTEMLSQVELIKRNVLSGMAEEIKQW